VNTDEALERADEIDGMFAVPTVSGALAAEVRRLRAVTREQLPRVEQVSEQINAEHEFLSEILDDAVHAWRTALGGTEVGS
jgi:hypothetical protein